MSNKLKIYKHFKGNTYIKFCEVIHSETKEEIIVYTCCKTGIIYVRPKEIS